MALQTFSFPFPETRFFRAGTLIYKFKIRGGSSYSGLDVMRGNSFNQELEDIIRTVLGNLDSLQPFSSAHFNVFPYKKWWEGFTTVTCKHGEERLKAYPFILTLYLERNTPGGTQVSDTFTSEEEVEQHDVSQPESKRCKRDSPLEEAILKGLGGDLEAESGVSAVGLHVDHPHAEGEAEEEPGRVDKKGAQGFDKPELTSGISMITGSGTSGEVQPGTTQDEGEEEEGEEEGENTDSDSGTPVRSGILTRLARHIFPFSLFFRES